MADRLLLNLTADKHNKLKSGYKTNSVPVFYFSAPEIRLLFIQLTCFIDNKDLCVKLRPIKFINIHNNIGFPNERNPYKIV
jgi:hypothetical protein